MPQRSLTAIGDQTPKPRIVQHRGRRYSIRLEPVFWQALETLASRQGLRLNRFLAERAQGYRGSNFASYLRVVCMLDAERLLARATLRASRDSVLELLMSCPSPGVLLSRHRTIVAHNEGFEHWLGPTHQPLAGAELTSVMQVRTRRPLNELWDKLLHGELGRIDVNVLHVQPGRAVAAPARLLAVRAPDRDGFYAVMWLAATVRSGPAPAAPHPEAKP